MESWFKDLTGSEDAEINTKRIVFIEMDSPVDEWGNVFIYKTPGHHNPNSFDLYSLGADGKTKTDGNDPDDIASWHESKRWAKHYNPPLITPMRIKVAICLGLLAVLVHVVRKGIANKSTRMS